MDAMMMFMKDNSINIIIASSDHNTEKANSIIRSIQELFDENKYITVKYNS